MATDNDLQVVESTESVRIDTALLVTLREWSAESGRTVAGLIRNILQPACLAYLEGKSHALREAGRDVAAMGGKK